MTKKAKLMQRFLNKSVDFEFRELKSLLVQLGYTAESLGRTSGSRIAFYNDETGHIIRLHKPHPTKILKQYQIEQVIEELKKQGVI